MLKNLMQCPNCGNAATIGDLFCEQCGTPLTADKATSIPSSALTGCTKCGAGSEQIDAQGFCSTCGFRTEATGDRIEINLQPNLGGISDRGLRHHRNEDYLALQNVERKNACVLVVCDGVSSSHSPDLAAKAAALSACTALTSAVENGIELEQAMNEAIACALASVCAIPYRSVANEEPPSTTIVAAVVQNCTATIGSIGDSRAYWISPSGSQQLTKDDSWLNDIVSSGQMTEAQAIKSAQAHAITRWLGADANDNSQPAVVKFNIPGCGHLLLCTDGLWNYAPAPTQIASLVHNTSTDADAISLSRRLVDFARSQGGHDNITVAVLSF